MSSCRGGLKRIFLASATGANHFLRELHRLRGFDSNLSLFLSFAINRSECVDLSRAVATWPVMEVAEVFPTFSQLVCQKPAGNESAHTELSSEGDWCGCAEYPNKSPAIEMNGPIEVRTSVHL